MKHLALLNPENATEEEAARYQLREAARAVIFDAEKNIAMLHVLDKEHYVLPGGGIKEGEDPLGGLKRECREEIGCEIEIIEELGSIVEYRKLAELKHISYAYLAKVVGEKGEPAFTEKELAKGFSLEWMSYDEAVQALQTVPEENAQAHDYIVPRERLILSEAKVYVS